MFLVRDGLYIGDLTALRTCAEAGITHVLSVATAKETNLLIKVWSGADPDYLPQSLEALVRKCVPLLDQASQNLLDSLEECLQFIEQAIASGGKVLVHCIQGVSRSGAVVTAYLMRKERLSADGALASLRLSSPRCSPNPAFMEQLRVFEAMAYAVDPSSAAYTEYLAKPKPTGSRSNGVFRLPAMSVKN